MGDARSTGEARRGLGGAAGSPTSRAARPGGVTPPGRPGEAPIDGEGREKSKVKSQKSKVKSQKSKVGGRVPSITPARRWGAPQAAPRRPAGRSSAPRPSCQAD